MVFKLVRTDSIEPCKIILPLGSYLIGRGNFLNCDDKRVSRKHGQMEVKDHSITLKAMHANPVFYKKNGMNTQILNQNFVMDLCHGDMFGLLPNSYWYELIKCAPLDVNRSPEIDNNNKEILQSDDKSLSNSHLNETVVNDDRVISPSFTQVDSSSIISNHSSPSIQRSDSPTVDRHAASEAEGAPSVLSNSSPSTIPQSEVLIRTPESSTAVDQPVPLPQPEASGTNKRCHSIEEDGGVKKIRTEVDAQQPVEVNQKPVDENQDRTDNLEPVTVKQEPVTVKQEPVEIKQEPVEPTQIQVQVKQEPVDIKQEPVDVQPGPSNGTVGSSSTDNSKKDDAKPDVNKQYGRERCIYGASCYRKNSEHKTQFSHPSDADWGSGERGACPWGGGCVRRDPRHWQHHDHPPGTRPPPPQQAGIQ